MPSKKPVRSNTWTKRAKARWSKAFRSIAGTRAPALIALVAICILTAAVALALRDASEPAQLAAADEQVAAAAAKSTAKTPATPKKAPARTVAADAKSPDTSSTPKSSTLSAAVTVSGCLERADNGFRLKDTAGEDAPKSRSWKSGFLKKGSASIDIVDAAHGLKLANQVGHRVSVTGTLIDHEMRAHSLQRVAGSCK